MRLTPEQIEQYDERGFLCPLRVLDDDDLKRFQRRFGELERELGEVKRLANSHHHFAWAYDLALHPRVLGAVESLLGPEVLVCATLVFGKYPRDPGFVAWHQDSVYSGFHRSPSTSAWIALSPSRPENGCMRVVPGSHRDGLLGHRERPGGGNLLRRGEEIEVEVDPGDAHDFVLRPGEMSVHHPNIIHGSRPNRSDVKRIGFIVRYVTPDYREPNEQTLVRALGTAPCSHLRLASAGRPPEGFRQAYERWRAEAGPTDV